MPAAERTDAHSRLVRVPSTPSDRFFDYCLEPYAPRCNPADRLRGESLLWHSLEVADIPVDHDAPLRALQRAAGTDMTVFGVKWFDQRLSWEMYLYDPQREDRQITAAALRESLAGVLDIEPQVPDSVRYFMYSFDLDAASLGSARVPELNIYLAFAEGQGGHSYAIRTGAPTELRNTYRFHRPEPETDAILHQIERSMWVNFSHVRLEEILIPQLFECTKICVAKKRFADAIYYSGITVDQLLWFFRRFDYPEAIVEFVSNERRALEHLLFDVGIDYRSGPDGRLEIVKTGYYSTF